VKENMKRNVTTFSQDLTTKQSLKLEKEKISHREAQGTLRTLSFLAGAVVFGHSNRNIISMTTLISRCYVSIGDTIKNYYKI